jgi:hypothetical protein
VPLISLAQPLEVEEVGTSFLEGLAGPALIAVAAIIAAFLAAWVARRNHAEQLANDRALRDLDHARQSIGAAVERVVEAREAVAKLSVVVKRAHEAREATREAHGASEKGLPTWRREGALLVDSRSDAEKAAVPIATRNAETALIEAETKAIKAETEQINRTKDKATVAWPLVDAVQADTFRLRITIGAMAAVVDRHEEIAETLKEWTDSLDISEDGFVYDQSETESHSDAVMNRLVVFVLACQRWSADQETPERVSWPRRVARRVTKTAGVA